MHQDTEHGGAAAADPAPRQDGVRESEGEFPFTGASLESQPACGKAAAGHCSAPRLSFKGNPGDPGFQRKVDIVKSVMGHPIANYMSRGKRTETFKKVCNALNVSDLFQGALKWEQVRDKFKEAEDEADAMLSQGEEQWLKLRQNGGASLNELDELYVDLAGHVKEFSREKERVEQENNEACDAANANLQAAMETVKCRYNAAAAFGNVSDEMDQSATPSSATPSATPSDKSPASGQETSPGSKRDGQKAFGAGSRRGKKPRAATNAGLTLDDAGVDDFQSSTSEMVSLMREALAADKDMMQSEKAIREEQARAATVAAQAALLKSKAELLDRVIRCRELQVEVPAELLAALLE